MSHIRHVVYSVVWCWTTHVLMLYPILAIWMFQVRDLLQMVILLWAFDSLTNVQSSSKRKVIFYLNVSWLHLVHVGLLAFKVHFWNLTDVINRSKLGNKRKYFFHKDQVLKPSRETGMTLNTSASINALSSDDTRAHCVHCTRGVYLRFQWFTPSVISASYTNWMLDSCTKHNIKDSAFLWGNLWFLEIWIQSSKKLC